MYLVYENDASAFLSKLILGVHQNESLAGCHLGTTTIQSKRIFLELLIIFARHNTTGYNLLFRYILVVPGIGFGSRSDNRLRKLLVFTHPIGHKYATKRAFSIAVLTPSMAGEITAHHHLHLERLTFETYGDHRIGSSNFPIGQNIGSSIEELGGYLIEHLSFIRDTFRQNHIECRNTVGSYHYQQIVVDIVNIADFTVINAFLTGKVEIGFY